MEERPTEFRLFADTGPLDESSDAPSPSFLRNAMSRAKEATEPVVAAWSQAEKSGILPLNQKEIEQFYTYVRSSLRSDSELKERSDLLIRQRVADPDRIIKEVQQAYAKRGVGRSPAAKVSEQKRDERIMQVTARPIIDKLERALHVAAAPLAYTNELIRSIIPQIIRPPTYKNEYEPSEHLGVSVLPKLSHSQGRILLNRFLDPSTFAIVLPGYADMVRGSALPGLIRSDVSALTLNDALHSDNDDFVWAALLSARCMYSVFYNRLTWLHHSTLISFSGGITAEAKRRQIEQWQAATRLRAQEVATFTAQHPIIYHEISKNQLLPLIEGAVAQSSHPYDTRGTLWEPESNK